MELILIIAGLISFILFYYFFEKNSKFDLYEDAVYFHSKKLTLPYASIISIERDIASREGRTTYFSYVITYYKEDDKVDSFRFYKAMTDSLKWNRFKSNVINANPFAVINESVL